MMADGKSLISTVKRGNTEYNGEENFQLILEAVNKSNDDKNNEIEIPEPFIRV